MTAAPANPLLLVGLDGSPRADAALRAATRLAQLMDGSIVALHVAEPSEIRSAATPQEIQRAHHAACARGEVILSDARGIAGDALVACELHFGEPAPTLCRRARELNADLLVVGSRGGGTLSRVLIGSVSASVAEGAPCSVLLVRGDLATRSAVA